jgi:hypothetical protein
MKMEQTECSETSAYKIQMPGNYPEESTRHSEHGESLKRRTYQDIPQMENVFSVENVCNLLQEEGE